MSGAPHYVYSEEPLPFRVVPPGEIEPLYARLGLSIPPAMSLYDATKHSPVNSATMDMIRESWATSAREADVILAVGARPVLDDGHIWQPIIEANAPVWFVGGQDDGYAALSARLRTRLVTLASTFEAALPLIEARLSAA